MGEHQMMKKYERYVAMCNKYGFSPLPLVLYQLGVAKGKP
jgi:hypothetical protein